MPPEQVGWPYKTKTAGWGLQWREGTQRTRRSGFKSRSAALAYHRDEIRPRLGRQTTLDPRKVTFDELADRFVEAHTPGREPVTIRNLRSRLVTT